MRTVELKIHRFVRPMRDSIEAATESAQKFCNLNKIGDALYKGMRTVYVPVDFSGMYSQDVTDVIKTEYNGKLCLCVSEHTFQLEFDFPMVDLTVPEGEGIVRLSLIEELHFDAEPV